ncbi:molybdate ABC transporter substrate-binding protein [Thalassotalea euphylliae]|uniref:molybdate ABC transporter substrate-binding protein n=1 Tax=Thalassotalea euphylliae TaxID=1655234 RepID=UPI003632281D
MFTRLYIAIFALVLIFFSPSSTAKTLTLNIAVASNFAATAKQLSVVFEQQHNVKLQWITGATGTLFQQIKHGAPYDVFLAADEERPRKLADTGELTMQSLSPFAIGQLAVYSTKQIPTDIKQLKQTLPALQRIAIANPRFAPYGLAAKAWLEEQALWQDNKRYILGLNVAQTFQQTRSGAVDIGFVALSQLIVHNLPFTLLEVDDSLLTQYGGVLARSQHQSIANSYLNFLTSEPIQRQLSALGYKPILSVSGESR